MQSIKLWYLRCLLDRKATPEANLEGFIKTLKPNLKHPLPSYAETVQVGAEELVEMIVIHGCFIIEYFRKYAGIIQASVDDPLFNMSWTRKVLVIDPLLLENRLPWFVLDCLYKLTKASEEKLSLAQLAHNCLCTDTFRLERIQVDQGLQIKHLLDLQRSVMLYLGENSNDDDDDDNTNGRKHRKGNRISSWRKGWTSIPCVKELRQAGVRFEVGSSNNLMDIKSKNGVLIIPPILVLDNAESLFRNLIAHEQCDRNLGDNIKSYAGCLDNLISSSDDLNYLRRKQIITCYLSTDQVSSRGFTVMPMWFII